jgi:CRP/FNR family cyclic AMP-dependent transcriptional regulator
LVRPEAAPQFDCDVGVMMFKRKKAHKPFEKLRGVSFFDGFSDDELQRVADLADDVEVEEGGWFIDQGRVGQECYVILEGRAGVYSGEEHIATLESGAMVGEMALVDHRPRTASVVAETELKLIGFDTGAFKELLETMPKVHDRVMQILSARLKPKAG